LRDREVKPAESEKAFKVRASLSRPNLVEESGRRFPSDSSSSKYALGKERRTSSLLDAGRLIRGRPRRSTSICIYNTRGGETAVSVKLG
jgi:hypothetical protein